jgi:hypothetical protein
MPARMCGDPLHHGRRVRSFFYRRRIGQILEEAVAYFQDLCGNDVICHKRHQGLVEARNIYRLPSIALREVMGGARIGTVGPIMPERVEGKAAASR